jgi:hypothetical protein
LGLNEEAIWAVDAYVRIVAAATPTTATTLAPFTATATTTATHGAQLFGNLANRGDLVFGQPQFLLHFFDPQQGQTARAATEAAESTTAKPAAAPWLRLGRAGHANQERQPQQTLHHRTHDDSPKPCER